MTTGTIQDTEDLARRTANILGQSSAAAKALQKLAEYREQGREAWIIQQAASWFVMPLPALLEAVVGGVPFSACLAECIKNRDLIREFDRLTGANLSLRGSPIELAIDQASGRLEKDIRAFIEFAWDMVFIRVPTKETH